MAAQLATWHMTLDQCLVERAVGAAVLHAGSARRGASDLAADVLRDLRGQRGVDSRPRRD